jgi:predicted dehydrogenase
MTQTIRWGIIGSGAVARRFVAGLPFVPEAHPQAIWGRNPSTTASLAASSGAHPCETLEELLTADLDAIYIATLPDTHAAYSTASLQAGKHVLCEKPVTLDAPELAQIHTLATAQDLLFMEAMKPPFFPLYRRLREHLERDPIGPIRFVQAGHALPDVPSDHPSWSLKSGGGSLMGIGVYQAFLAVDWLGPATEVQAIGRLTDTGVDAFATLQTRHADGIAQLFSGLDLSTPGHALLAGPGGHATIHGPWWNPSQATILYNSGRLVELSEPFEGGGFNYETTHFCDLIRQGQRESPILPHATSSQVMSILDRARQQIGVNFPT